MLLAIGLIVFVGLLFWANAKGWLPSPADVETLAKFDSKCAGCGGKIKKGDPIYKAELEFEAGRRTESWVCDSCAAGAPRKLR